MTTTAPPRTITAPGVYGDVPELDYHSDALLANDFGPSLSSTGARTILDSPALFRWRQDNPEPPKAAFDLGHAVHAKVLGVGLNIAVIPDDLLASNGAASTKDAKAFIAEAQARGDVAIKSDTAALVNAIADAVLTHPVAGAILSQGEPEQSAYATDPDTGVTMRARIDWLRDNAAVDLKSVGRQGGARPEAFARAAADHGYHIQSDFYLRVLALLGMVDLPFIHIVVEVDPPHLVSVVQLDDEALQVGHEQVRRALDIYARCRDTDEWPGYSPEIELISLPRWAVR